MRKINQILAIALLSIAFVSCSKEFLNEDATTNSIQTATTLKSTGLSALCGSDTLTLWAGQTIDAGTLIVSNDETNLYVTYNTTGDFGTLHLWVGTDLTLLPTTPNGSGLGTPIPGQFPYVYDAAGLTTYTFTIPLANISFYTACGNTINVVAHAEVSINGGNETAFGGDIAGKGTNRWYFYTAYVTSCCSGTPPPTPLEKLGTAFAKGGYVFTTDKKSNPENQPSLNLTKNRWGWAINLTEPTFKTYDLYVGAGLNKISNAKLVGTASVNYTGTQATITYTLNPGFAIEEAHVYANDFKPTTLAPGQYGNTYYFNPFAFTHTFTVDVMDTNGDGVWFIIHAVAFGPALTNVN
jgi:hypothetical protein